MSRELYILVVDIVSSVFGNRWVFFKSLHSLNNKPVYSMPLLCATSMACASPDNVIRISVWPDLQGGSDIWMSSFCITFLRISEGILGIQKYHVYLLFAVVTIKWYRWSWKEENILWGLQVITLWECQVIVENTWIGKWPPCPVWDTTANVLLNVRFVISCFVSCDEDFVWPFISCRCYCYGSCQKYHCYFTDTQLYFHQESHSVLHGMHW